MNGEILVKFKPGAQALEGAGVRAQLDASRVHSFRSGAEHWRLGPGVSVEQAVERMRRNPIVEYAEPNYVLTVDVVPNDPNLGNLWGFINNGQTGGTPDADIDAEMAWGVSTGRRSVIVGIIDTGCDYNHQDLAANIWTNPGEIAGNGIDDDGNGFVDDVHGYDFANNDGDPFDDHGHGTHVSGTIGAVGNNGAGVVGVNWQVSILCAKFISAAGSGTTADAIRALDYTVMMGVDLTNNSWGGAGFSQALMDAIAAANAADQAFVASAGNSNLNNDVTPHYPSSYDLPNVIAVAATDHNDAKASFSNYGVATVDLGAPGVNILSTLPGNSYGLLSGTSMAAPHASGVAAIARAISPDIPADLLKNLILSHVDPKASMQGITVSGGRLNAFLTITTPDTDPPGAVDDLVTNNPGSNTMELSWTATGDDGSTGTATSYEARYSAAPIDDRNFSAAARAGNEPFPGAAGTPESIEVRGLAADTTYYFAIKTFDEWGNAGRISNLATGRTLPPPTGSVFPASLSESLLTGQRVIRTVTLSNVGVGTLDFAIPTPIPGQPLATSEPQLPPTDDPDAQGGNPVTGSHGGPDAFGYRWVDSDEPGGPIFSWVEISGTGTAVPVTGNNQTSGPIPLASQFPFYGTLFNSIRVCTNGWFSFTSSSTAYWNQPLPHPWAPENLVAPFFDDLYPDGATRIYSQAFPDGLIVEWIGMPRHGEPGSSMTFEVILHANGEIIFQYLDLVGTLNNATVGIQDAAMARGLQVAFNEEYLHENLAVRISALPRWLGVAPASGRLAAGESIPLAVNINASSLEPGTYPAQIRIDTNDTTNPVLTVDVTLTVIAAPDAAVQPASLDFGDAFLGHPKSLALTVMNNGTDVLHVSGVVGSHADLSPSPASFDVLPHAAQNVTVTWVPSAPGPFSGSVTVLSDDADEARIVVGVTGNAIPAPVLEASPASFSERLFSDQAATRTLNVRNTGGSPLVITAAAVQNPAVSGAIVVDPGMGADGRGGPDSFGYRWEDSDIPEGPAFQWAEISAAGAPISFPSPEDSLSDAIPMGMAFPFYGNKFSAIKVSTNGWLTFDTTYAGWSGNNNLPVPSASLARNSIAIFWDNLHLRSGSVRYLNDGTRFILQYTNVGRSGASTGHNYTFQVQLYPSGQIILQYLTMSGRLNSATIGIQDESRTIALQVVFNATYLHDNLAIRISRTPDWLSLTPLSATIQPGQDFDFAVSFDAAGRLSGTLRGNLVLSTNIPSQPEVLVPATLDVIGVPQVRLFPASLGYGTVFAGYTQLASFQVVNIGTGDLSVSSVDTTDPSLVAEEPPSGDVGSEAAFIVPPRGSRVMNLRWNPVSPDALDAQVRISTDDPLAPMVTLPVTGKAIPAPVAVHAPSSFTESLSVGEVVTRTLHLENQGGSELTFSTSLRALGTSAVTVYPEARLDKEEPDPRPGVLGSGGPDLFGYRWKDSDDPEGPVFSWFDISSIGEPIAGLDGDDENDGPIEIGFPFPFYGNTFTTLRVTTNGWISFTSFITDSVNDPLPNSASAENLIAAFFDDLDFRGAQRATYYSDGTRFIVQWTNAERHSPGSSLTFQVILYPNGRIVMQYLTMSGVVDSATIGLQNASLNDGVTVAFNSAYVHNNLAVEFRRPFEFVTVSPSNGILPPGGSADLDVRIDAMGQIGGDYASGLDLITNDPARGVISVPVSLHLTGIPDIEVEPRALAFPTTFVGSATSSRVVVRNVGTDVLHITDVQVAGDYSISGITPPVSLPFNGVIGATVTFAPTTDGGRPGSLTITSDDPDEPVVVVSLAGEALFPPIAGVSPTAISTALAPGGNRTKTVRIANTGGSDLTWTAGATISDGVKAPGTLAASDRGQVEPGLNILGSGGPDAFGYRWKDSNEPGGPAFSWTDIRGIGTPITNLTGDDENSGPIPIGFSFPFYGNTFTAVRVTTNGWLSFTSPSAFLSNMGLPSGAYPYAPENLLAVFWDDLAFNDAVCSRYHNDGTRFIVQWTNVDRFYTGSDLTFQAILYPNGRIVYQYLSMRGVLNSATIGIQNATKDVGLTVVVNHAYVHDDLAVEIKHPVPQWIRVSPSSGTIPAGAVQDVTVTLDAAGLYDGLYHGTIAFASNDPFTPLLSVPVTLNVGLVAPTLMEFEPRVLNLWSKGNTVKVVVELPSGLDPHAIRISSVLLNDAVPALAHPVAFMDEDGDGLEEISLKFDRAAVEAILPQGDSVEICVQGEVEDVQWWRGCTAVRTIRPRVTATSYRESVTLTTGAPILLYRVVAANRAGDAR